MTQTISRMYGSHDNALRAASELRKDRIWSGHIYVVGPGDGPSEDALTAAVMQSYVLKAHAQIYAKGIMKGGTLVTVHAPFGYGVTAAHVLDQFQPIDSGLEEPVRIYRVWDEAAPLSSAAGLPALIDNPAPMSALWNVRAVLPGRATVSGAIGLPELVDSRESLSDLVRLPLLSHNPAPLSSLLRIPLLWRG